MAEIRAIFGDDDSENEEFLVSTILRKQRKDIFGN
jgi:hypothetical protein